MTSTTLNPSDLKRQLRQHLADDLDAVNGILMEQFRSQSRFVSDLTEHVSRFRGKQIRPILLLLMERMTGGTATQNSRRLAAAVEMIHTATLVHDDVIDEADTRRHVATVHRRWNTETSVLLGDYLFSKSFHLSATTGDAEACRLIGRATDRTCEGELNQIAARLEQSTSEVDYFRIIRDKTGQLFALACLLGVRAAGGTETQCRAARRFGMRLGLAFQIADDVLDLTQSSGTTGKDAGNDIQNRRLTLPLLRAIAAGESPETLWHDLMHQRRSPQLLAGLQSAAGTADQLVSRAISDLEYFPAGEDRELLRALAAFAAGRTS